MAVASRSRFLAEAFHQLWAINATPQRKPSATPEPDERESIWNHEVRTVQDFLEAGRMLRLHQAVHVRDGDVTADAGLVNPVFHSRYHIGDLHRVNAHAENAER